MYAGVSEPSQGAAAGRNRDKGNSIVSDKAADESVMSYQFLQPIAPSWGWTRGFWRSTSGWTLVVSQLVQWIMQLIVTGGHIFFTWTSCCYLVQSIVQMIPDKVRREGVV